LIAVKKINLVAHSFTGLVHAALSSVLTLSKNLQFVLTNMTEMCGC